MRQEKERDRLVNCGSSWDESVLRTLPSLTALFSLAPSPKPCAITVLCPRLSPGQTINTKGKDQKLPLPSPITCLKKGREILD